MSCDVERLEALIDQTLGPRERSVVQAHLARCPKCVHELRWLRAERVLFEQRAHRGAAARALPPSRVPRRDGWRQVPLALLAACFALVVLWRPSATAPAGFEHGSDGALMSAYSGDPALFDVQQRFAACLIATPGAGSACEPLPLPASFGH